MYGDFLWSELGGKMVPNAGFLPTAVVPLGSGSEALEGEDDGEDGQEDGGRTEGAAEVSGVAAGGKGGDTLEGGEASSSASVASDVRGLSLGGGDGRNDRSPLEDMDELLEMTLLQVEEIALWMFVKIWH